MVVKTSKVVTAHLTSALTGAPPRTQAKRELLIGVSALERVVRQHSHCVTGRGSTTERKSPETWSVKVTAIWIFPGLPLAARSTMVSPKPKVPFGGGG